ncbi:MAG: hypothetical protein IIW50_03270 [Alistipes sp.]|nr:hypothetical protein [Alistipes sp.]
MRTILTILLTSLVWAGIITLFFEPRSSEHATEPATEVVEQSIPEQTKKVHREQKKSQRAEKKRAAEEAKVEETEVEDVKVVAQPKAKAQEPKKEEPKVAEEPKTKAQEPKVDEPKAEEPKQESKLQTIDIAREIDGLWEPVVGAEYPLEITKYNVAIQHRGFENRVKYSLKGDKLRIDFDINARCEITKEGDTYYLEIYNSKDFAGKYKRKSQPRKIAMRPIDASLYAEKLCGKWTPINGQKHPIEFSKYGTAIQHCGYENRVQYTLNGDALRIYFDNKASIVISEDASYYYLELYNSKDFSGRYRRTK